MNRRAFADIYQMGFSYMEEIGLGSKKYGHSSFEKITLLAD